jgi:transcriptional regulator with XRE-family HTH domain
MRLRELRKEAGLSQKDFAKEFGAAQNTVSQWETGTRRIDDETLCRIAAYFDVSIDYLLERTNEKKSLANNVSEAKREMIALIDQLSDEQVTKLLQIANAALDL